MSLLLPWNATWTERFVASLPPGEDDAFDRKSGRILESRSPADALGKPLSAFANSGGGHVIIGVEDDGRMTGVDSILRGRQSTREWLENLVATSTDYPLARYRVHEVVRSEADSSIEAGKCVLVVDVADSELSPHRCRADQLYYMRQAGRSVPAPHYSVDLLRHRASQATLEVVAIRVDVSMAALQPERVSETAIGILVENTSRTRAALDSEVLVSISGPHIDESARWQPRNGENRRILPGV